MIEVTRKSDCCGCGACAQACGKGCIAMVPDGEGFLYPVVDAARCVRCGLCLKACPMTAQAAPSGEPTAYAAYARDGQIRQESSSGGIFSLAARWVLDRQGVVVGAAFDGEFDVCHVMIQSQDQLPRLRGSKYVQSRMGDAYCRVREALKAGKTVLFSGVACQIAGLKTFLGRDYDELYTIDVLCHGVPSPKVWRRYIQDQEAAHAGRLTGASLRSKQTGWKTYSVALDFGSGRSYRRDFREDPYMRCFLSDSCLRPSCHSCRFKAIPRMSDLTLGDAWGIGGHMPEMDDDRGTSVVIVNTQKGRRLWQQLAPEVVAAQGQTDVLLPPGADSRRPVRPHAKRARFFKALESGADMTRLAKLSRRPLHRRVLSFGKRTLKRFF